MEVQKIKQQLHTSIDSTNNEMLLEDLLAEAITRNNATAPNEIEGLTKEDYEELMLDANKTSTIDNSISYEAFKASVSKWSMN